MASGNAKINVIVDGLKQVQALERSLNNISRLSGKINGGGGGAVPVRIEKTTAQLKEAQRASMIRTRNIGDQIERLSAQGLNVDKARAAIKKAAAADSAKELGMSLADVRKMTLEEVIGWSAYFQVLNEDQEKEMEKIRRRR